MNIRITGGYLGAFSLLQHSNFHQIKELSFIKSHYHKLLEKAAAFVNAQSLNYSNSRGFPYPFTNVVNPQDRSFHTWTKDFILAEVGSHQLEFLVLDELLNKYNKAQHYNNYPFSDKSTHVFDSILNSSTTLYPILLNQYKQYSIGAFGDSFYEYILKMYIKTRNPFYKDKFIQVTVHLEDQLLATMTIKDTSILYFKTTRSDKFDHLTCFTGGMYALASQYIPEYKDHYLKMAKELTLGCYLIYQSFPTGLGPDICMPQHNNCAPKETMYNLRPELVESIYYLYKLTKDPTYVQWNYNIAKSIEQHCKTNYGYASVDVNTQMQHMRQDSWFVAETLKYLLLTFDDILHLDDIVFNTEAHAFYQ